MERILNTNAAIKIPAFKSSTITKIIYELVEILYAANLKNQPHCLMTTKKLENKAMTRCAFYIFSWGNNQEVHLTNKVLT